MTQIPLKCSKLIKILKYLQTSKLNKTLPNKAITPKGNDMSTTILQQILSGRLLLVVIVGAKK